MDSKEMIFEDVFGYNSFGFRIVLPKMPEKLFMYNTNYLDWLKQYLKGNDSHSRETVNSVFEKLINMKCAAQSDLKVKLLAQMRSVEGHRAWCDIELARAGYISRLDPPNDKGMRYNSITKKANKVGKETIAFSSNSLCGPFGENGELIVVLLPYYADKTLDELSYSLFEYDLRKLNPHITFSRLQTFMVWLTVVTTDFCFDEEEDIQFALDQAKNRAADKIWAKLSGEDACTYTHPTDKQVEKLRKATNLLLIPECASIRTPTADFFYVDFRTGVQIINRGKIINTDTNTATWQAVVRDRQRNFRPKLTPAIVDNLLQHLHHPSNAKYFKALTTMRSMVAVDHSLSAESYLDPFRHTYMMISVEKGDNGLALPLTQPIWCKRSVNVSFMLLTKILNPRMHRRVASIVWMTIMGLYPWLRGSLNQQAQDLGRDMLEDSSLPEPVNELWGHPPRPENSNKVNETTQSRNLAVVPRPRKRTLAADEQDKNDDQEVQRNKVPRASIKVGNDSGPSQDPDKAAKTLRAPAATSQSQRTPTATFSGTARKGHPKLTDFRKVMEVVEKEIEKAHDEQDPDIPILMDMVHETFTRLPSWKEKHGL
ncbi:MAG: hypothetical protein M1812_004637 [Candelaria pacifica]|nr:MAG: hypothetical protein M1812_004637 [Candelaria pacifica]